MLNKAFVMLDKALGWFLDADDRATPYLTKFARVVEAFMFGGMIPLFIYLFFYR
ncbi:MAG: hypothetical protein IJ905_04455 [Fibrobacter sp.]|nr:hypothetical protein [Fibrobacter sp.]